MRAKSHIPFLSGLVFALVFIMHGLRLIFDWSLVVGEVALPLWLSILGLVLAGLLALANFSQSRK